ncbi:HupE/UreJ family protein [Phenylobacterium sp.]|uniref:HupE/UreJ family protein n=1 Tax=Phenylobacterium sp. TaxID=1871053 RepID=UPI0025FBCFF1|nr:HupE/UreJ family protein [Phenylobacterium sp.]MBX3485486.1 HupE/UreJ family protein [Phenylobacterium sp.]MCW5759087.1 HupE/UreJ family protein [Phenylobacterium sp.]
MRLLAALCLALTALFAAVAPAQAHEVRPALVQIRETGPRAYEVVWKRPVVGDMALRLVPHLSGGALEKPAEVEQAAPGYVTRVWRVRDGPPLMGQTLEIEGLAQSVTDVIVRVTPRDGEASDHVLKPAEPRMVLGSAKPSGVAVPAYLLLGVEHILIGIDHLLFVLGLLLLIGPNWKLVKAVTGFTVAHSLTLALAAFGVIRFPSAAIEALVALSILFVAVELMPARRAAGGLAQRRPWLIAFTFGLLHGMAFAGVLADIGLPAGAAPEALFLFNVGVEIGQLTFIAAVLIVMAAGRRLLAMSHRTLPRWAALAPAYAIGGLSAYWLIERTIAAI